MWSSFQILDIMQHRAMIPEKGRQVMKTQWSWSTRNKKITPKHIIIKFLKTTDKGKFLKQLKSKDTEEQRWECQSNNFQVPKENNSEFYTEQKYLSKMKMKWKLFETYEEWKPSCLLEMLKNVFSQKENGTR